MQALAAARQLLYNRQLLDSSCLEAVRAALCSRPGLQPVMSTLSASLPVGRRTGCQLAPGKGLQSAAVGHCAAHPPQRPLQRASAHPASCITTANAPHRPLLAGQRALRAVHCCAAATQRSRRAIRQQQQEGPVAEAQTAYDDLCAHMRQLSTEANSSAGGLFDSQLHASLFLQEVAEVPAAAADNLSTAHQQEYEQQVQDQQQEELQHQQQQQQLPWCETDLVLSDQQQQHLQYLRQHTLPSEVLLVGVDPDTNGAIAVVRSKLHWSLTDPSRAADSSSNSNGSVQKSSRGSNGGSKKAGSKDSSSGSTNSNGSNTNSSSSSSSTAEVLQLRAHMGLPAAVSVYDMPVETIVTQTKTNTGKRRVRRRLDILQTMAVIRQILQDTTAETADTQSQAAPQAAAHATSPSSSTDAPATSSANSSEAAVDPDGDQDPPSSSSNNGRILLRAVVEVASILPSNGRLATLNQGYSVGAWTALLASHGFDVTTVHVLSWKKDMGLLKRDKDSSRQLAKTLFQQAGAPQDELLRTKNTHGRAEALLLAAWGLGWKVEQGTEGPSQGALRATVHMDGGQHSIPLPQQHQQQLLLAPDPSATAAAAEAVTSDDESSSQLLCMPSGMGAAGGARGMLGVVTRAHLTQRLQPLSNALQHQQPPRILDVGLEMAAAVAAVGARAAARQAEKEQKAAARKAAAEERAAAKAAEKAAKAAERAAGHGAWQRRSSKGTAGSAAVEEPVRAAAEAARGAGARRSRKRSTS